MLAGVDREAEGWLSSILRVSVCVLTVVIPDGRAAVRWRAVGLRESEDSSMGSGHPDGYLMGVITDFCKTGSEAGEGQCEPWVNQPLGN